MVSLPHIWLVIAAALGSGGCLLFTDPINKAPAVKITSETKTFERGIAATFTVQVSDEDPMTDLRVSWAEFPADDQGCAGITAATWRNLRTKPEPIRTDATYTFVAQDLKLTCLCAQAVDHYGAVGQDCYRIEPKNTTPEAVITDANGLTIASPLPKCSQVQLSAESSKVPVDDKIDYAWSLDYTGSDPMGKQTQLVPCKTGATGQASRMCFYAAVPGLYTARLTVKDTPPGTVAAPVESAPTTAAITIAEDTPACIQQSDPEVDAKRVLLTRSPSLSGRYESRTFSVSSVKDDCEPYPPRTDIPQAQQVSFLWYVMDRIHGKTTWQPWAYPTNANAFTIDPGDFPDARAGDTIGLRVEVRDAPTQASMATSGPACADTVLLCCGSDKCSGTKDCVRWTTWTVQFEP